jgi:hypothetical protein
MINTRYRRLTLSDKRVVLYTPLAITNKGIDPRLKMYDLEECGDNTTECRVKPYGSVDSDKFMGTIISAYDIDEGFIVPDSERQGNIATQFLHCYIRDTLDPIKLFICQSMHGMDMDLIQKQRDVIAETVAYLLKRPKEDITVIDQINVDDPYDVDENFKDVTQRRIYRLTRSMRMMTDATHIIFIDVKNPGCRVEEALASAYHLNTIPFRPLSRVASENPELNEKWKECALDERKRGCTGYNYLHQIEEDLLDPYGTAVDVLEEDDE